MFKKLAIVTVTLLIATVAILLSRQSSFHTITVTYNNLGDTKVSIRRELDDQIVLESVKSGESNKLQKGYYTITVKSDIATAPEISFEISEGDMELTLPLSLKKTELTKIANKYKSTYIGLLEHEYAHYLEQFKPVNPRVYLDGKWASMELHYIGDDVLNRDTLTVIYKKSQSSWSIAAKPAITHSLQEYPHIPITVLEKSFPLYPPKK